MPAVFRAVFSSVLATSLIASIAFSAEPAEEEESEGADIAPLPSASALPPSHARDGGAAWKRAPIVRDGMALIPAGKFKMGSRDAKAAPNERPSRVIALPSFLLDVTEVTVADYRACVEKKGCTAPLRTSPLCTFEKDDGRLPINCVSWVQADGYCRSVGKRLPRETEWEAAAHGPDSMKFPWAGHASNCFTANTLLNEHTSKRCTRDAPSRVGAHPGGRSPYGIDDMAGNVEEWTADYYSETFTEFAPTSGSSRVLRGGGWLSAPSFATTTARDWGSALEAGPNVGFRCAKDETNDAGTDVPKARSK